MPLRLDVALVGFVLFTLVGPLFGGYLAAWLIANLAGATAGDAFAALFGGGTDTLGLAAAIGAGAGLGLTLRIAAGPILDAFVSGWPDGATLMTDPRRHLPTFGRARGSGAEIDEEGMGGLGGAVGWLGSLLSALLLFGLAIAGWPRPDEAAVELVRSGTASALDWGAAAFPAVARGLIAAVAGILGGAIWSTMSSPVADAEP